MHAIAWLMHMVAFLHVQIIQGIVDEPRLEMRRLAHEPARGHDLIDDEPRMIASQIESHLESEACARWSRTLHRAASIHAACTPRRKCACKGQAWARQSRSCKEGGAGRPGPSGSPAPDSLKRSPAPRKGWSSFFRVCSFRKSIWFSRGTIQRFSRLDGLTSWRPKSSMTKQPPSAFTCRGGLVEVARLVKFQVKHLQRQFAARGYEWPPASDPASVKFLGTGKRLKAIFVHIGRAYRDMNAGVVEADDLRPQRRSHKARRSRR